MADLLTALRDGLEQEIAYHGAFIPGCDFADRMRARVDHGSPLRACTTLEEICTYVKGAVLTPIDEARSNAVCGMGNPEADLVIVGEAPGADEDAQGLPFVGKAGQLLTKILKAINLEREEVFITNILKTRPPGNRNPNSEEIAAHLPILFQQLSLIRPKLLCCLGRVAGNTLLGSRQALGTMRKEEHAFCGIPLYVTYHPAALLRNPHWKRPTWEDVQRLRAKYDALLDI